MNTDAKLLLCSALTFATGGGQGSTNVIDLDETGRRIGAGEPLAVELNVTTAATDTGDETYTFAVRTSSAENMGTPTTQETVTIARTALTLGSKHLIPLSGVKDYLRYLDLYFTGTNDPSVGITAHLVPLAGVGNTKEYATAGGFTN
jgi:hypothetical protein